MPPESNVEEILLRIKTDKAAIQTAKQSIEDIRSVYRKAAQEFHKEWAKSARQSSKEFERFADDVRKSIGRVQQTSRDTQGAAFGTIDRLATSGGRALTGLGVRGAGDVIQGVGDIGQLAEAAQNLPQFTAALKGIPDAARSAVDSIGKGNIGAVGAIAGLAVVIGILQQNAAKAKEAALAELDARQRVIALVVSGTNQDIEARIKQLEAEKRTREEQARDAAKLFADLQLGINSAFGSAAVGLQEVANVIGIASGEYSAAKDNAEKAANALDKTNLELDLLRQASTEATEATRKLAEEQRRLAEVQSLAGNIRQLIQSQVEAQSLLASGTAKQVQDRIDALNREKEAIKTFVPFLRDQLTTLEKGTDAYKAANTELQNYVRRLTDLDIQLSTLGNNIIPVLEAREEEARRIKETTEAVKKFNTDALALEQRTAEQRAAIQQKLNDAIVEATKRAAEAAETALQRLKDQRAELAQGLAQDLADDERQAQIERLNGQIEFQQEEARSYRDHLRNLQDIRRSAFDREQDLILARDFLGLFQLRRQTNSDLKKANSDFVAAQEERAIQYRQELDTQNRALLEQRQQRLIAYQRALRDAQDYYDREIQNIRTNKSKQLQEAYRAAVAETNLANQKYRAEYEALRTSTVAQIQLAQQGAQARLQIEAQLQRALLAQAQALLSGLSSSMLNGYSNQQRMIAGGSSSVSYSPTINIQGSNPQQVQQYVNRAVVQGFSYVMGRPS